MTDKSKQKISPVFKYASILVLILVLFGMFMPARFGEMTGALSNYITVTFGWYYMILVTVIILFSVFLIFSPIGKLKLGKPNDEPEFRTISWLAMLFSAGMGIGLVFYGASEPISHYLAPPSTDRETKEAFMESMRSTIFHYGFHPWAVYGIVALSLAYFQFRKNEDGLLSKTLRPIFGDRVDGPLGTVVDVLAVFATVIGVAVSLGVGTLQINAGLNYLFNVPQNILVQFIIIFVVTILFLASAWSGLSKGIQYLSNINMSLAVLLLVALFFIGPTILILNMMTTTAGSYLGTFLQNSFDVAPLYEQKSEWLKSWTIYYWGWWISWSPFVGIFIARVSKGRSIRQFVIAVLLVPTIVSLIWFSVFGTTGITVAQNSDSILALPPETQLFAIFNELPLSVVLSTIAILLVSIFFITSADSATFVLGMQTSYGTLQPPKGIKVIWGVLLSLIAFVLLLTGGDEGLGALQSAAIISAFPFSIVIILMTISFYKDADLERRNLGLTITPDQDKLEEYYEHVEEHPNTDMERENPDNVF